MGSAGSRPRVRKVAPCRSLQEEGGQHKAQWTLPALPVTAELPSGSLGQRKTTLPPLKQELTLSTLSEPCLAGNMQPKQSNNTSIIHAHPPRRPQALQPLAFQSGHTSTANQIVMGRDCRDGLVHRFSTAAQTGHSGSGRVIQGGFLEAQTALSQQAHRHRRAHLRQAREQRRRRVVHGVNGSDTEGVQRLRLVRRPTERDIFWDESTGERLDPSSLLPPKSPQLCENRQHNQPCEQLSHREERIQRDRAQDQTHRAGHRGLSVGRNLLWTTERESTAEYTSKTQRNSWMESDSPRICQAEHMRSVGGLWDYKMD